MCVAMCPSRNLGIKFNQYGEYAAYDQGSKCSDTCNLCLSVCPFCDNQENEDTLAEKMFSTAAGMKYCKETGYYQDCFVGYSAMGEYRKKGSSGGMASWMLERLLQDNLVDYVGCVSATNDRDRLFKFSVSTTYEEVRGCSGSCYYPVELSEIIQHILSHDGRYAIIALPCMCKAIRLAMEVNTKLRERITFLLGLTCGQTKSKFFAEYVCSLGGGNPKHLSKIEFRVKDADRHASDYGMRFLCESPASSIDKGLIFYSEGIGEICMARAFTPKPCDFCDDIFAELADICFMDAWLAKYSSDWQGHSIVLVRSSAIRDLLVSSIKDGSVHLDNINIDNVIRSQSSVVRSKRVHITERIKLAKMRGQVVPSKRLGSCSAKLSLARKGFVRIQRVIRSRSREEWIATEGQMSFFTKRMKPYMACLNITRFLLKFEYIPQGLIRRLRKISK
jgi:coenzyme F420-reducing hydrogenase beta subunit